MKPRGYILIVSLVVIGISLWKLAKSPVLQLQSIEIVMDPESKESLLFEKIRDGLTASLSHFTGLPFWKISLDNVMIEVKKDHRVRLARIQREFPHHLRVIVVPHEPLLGYMDEQGKVYPVARDATLLPNVALKDLPNFPLLRGKEFASDIQLREKAIEMMESIPTEGRFQRGMISEILHSNKEGFLIFLSNQSAEIKMGEGEFDLKASRVEKVLSYLHNRNLTGRVVDARFAKKVVVRVRGADR
jgi:cell division septal protein FtsQ